MTHVWRTWVRFSALYTIKTFFTLICFKIFTVCLKKTDNKRKRCHGRKTHLKKLKRDFCLYKVLKPLSVGRHRTRRRKILKFGPTPVWPDGLIICFNIWPFTTLKICPIAKIFPKLGSNFCQLLNEPSKDCQRYLFFYKLANFHQIWSHCSP